MFTEVLFKNTREILVVLGKSKIMKKTYLAGGTGVALHLGQFRGIRFSFFYYPYPILFPFVNFCGIKVLDLRDIGVMKIDAVATRGTKRDFIDLYFICKEFTPLKDLLLLYDKKFKKLAINYVHIKKSLVYFVDAERDETPEMLKKVDWNRIKEFFEGEVKHLRA